MHSLIKYCFLVAVGLSASAASAEAQGAKASKVSRFDSAAGRKKSGVISPAQMRLRLRRTLVTTQRPKRRPAARPAIAAIRFCKAVTYALDTYKRLCLLRFLLVSAYHVQRKSDNRRLGALFHELCAHRRHHRNSRRPVER